jgi:hypothetical protein
MFPFLIVSTYVLGVVDFFMLMRILADLSEDENNFWRVFIFFVLLLAAIFSGIKADKLGTIINNNRTELIKKKTLQFFSGKHKLLALNNKIRKESYSTNSGSLFILIGGYNSTSSEKYYKYANFVWMNNNNEYIPSEISYDKIKFVIDNTLTEPYCIFTIYEHFRYFDDEDWKDYIKCVTFYVKEENITTDIKVDFTK